MGWMIVKQPNGLYARFSSIVDDFTHVNLSRAEAIDECVERAGREVANAKVERADTDTDPHTHKPREGDGLQRWRDCLQTIRIVQGARVVKSRERAGA